MELKSNQVVKLRNNIFGVVASFNNKPFQIIFASYTSPLGRYDAELKNKNNNYDIVEVYDGSNVNNVLDVFKRSFNADGLELVWKRED